MIAILLKIYHGAENIYGMGSSLARLMLKLHEKWVWTMASIRKQRDEWHVGI